MAVSSLYSTLPETLDTQHAREASQLQSQVRAPVRSRWGWGWGWGHRSSQQKVCSSCRIYESPLT